MNCVENPAPQRRNRNDPIYISPVNHRASAVQQARDRGDGEREGEREGGVGSLETGLFQRIIAHFSTWSSFHRQMEEASCC